MKKIGLFLLTSNLVLAQSFQVYKVQKDDTISDLLKSRDSGVLYGKKGLVHKNLSMNRLSDLDSKKLEVGSYIMLPAQKKLINDSISTGQSATAKSGFLSTRISKHQNIEFNIKFSRKTMNSDRGGEVSFGENYEAGVKLIGNQYSRPTIGFAVSNSNSIEFETQDELLVDLKPSFKLFSQADLLRKSNFAVGVVASMSEDSNVDYENDNFFTRRDQNIWIGAQSSYLIAFKSFELDLSAVAQYNIVTNAFDGNDEIRILSSHLESKINLTKDYYLSAFLDIESIDRESNSFGLNFIYKL